MIPLWLARLLPGIGLALAAAGALWWSGAQGYRRAMIERDARDARMLAEIRTALRATEAEIAETVSEIGGDYEARRAILAHSAAALTPLVIKETDHDPRLADPAAGLTPGLLDAVNRARAAGACAAAAAGLAGCPLPAFAAGAGPDDR